MMVLALFLNINSLYLMWLCALDCVSDRHKLSLTIL